MKIIIIFLFSLFTFRSAYSANFDLQSISVRGRIAEHTVLGKDAPVNFEEYDLAAHIKLPWYSYSDLGWSLGTSLMMSAGVLSGANTDALVMSLIPEITLKNDVNHFMLDVGVGSAVFSESRFGVQDFGKALQFALTLGISIPIYKNLGVGYRFLHYSDAGGYGPHTTGADFHMIEFHHRIE